MQAFVVAVIVKVLTNEDVEKTLRKLLGDLLNDILTQKISPLVPLAAASAAHAFAQLMPNVTHDIEDVVKVADTVREDLNSAIPQINIGIPLIDDVINAWRPR